MNLKLNSRKQFTAMFCQTMKLTSIMAICAFLCFMLFTSFNYGMYEPDYIYRTAHFFDDIRYNGFEDFANLAFLGAGVLNAVLCFNFVWSKKQANVVLSLGMKKSDIYFAKILGGIVPMAASVTLAGIIETIANVSGGYVLNGSFFAMAAFTMLSYLAVYILAFALSSAVMANTGNIIEGVIFTGIIGLFPMTLKAFLSNLFWQFTHGAAIPFSDYMAVEDWNWENPFTVFENFNYSFMTTYFEPENVEKIKLVYWSGAIMALVYAAACIALGYLGFRKRRNEICGTWGRAKGMNEIAGAVTGFYSAYVIGLYMLGSSHGNANLLTYLACAGSFLAAYIIFKLIFGYKRSKEVKASLNRFPVYATVLGAVVMIFTLGLFGYSSKIPEADTVASVDIRSPYCKFLDEKFSGSSEFALKVTSRDYDEVFPELDGSMYVINANSVPEITYTDYQDITKVIGIHESFVRDGKIKNNGEHSCASDLMITYTLKNGKKITRYYSESTEGTTLKLLTLNDSSKYNKELFEFLNEALGFEYSQEAVLGKNEEGYLDIDEYIDEYGTVAFPYSETNEDFTNTNRSLYFLAQQPCYLFPTDMSTGYKLGYIERDFLDAIITDIKNMSANQYFNHSAEDEIGVLSFGLSASSYMMSGGVVIGEDKWLTDTENAETPDGTVHETSWNINSADIKSVVITKAMKNTVAYLEEHDLMKHLERKLTAKDVKSVKLATMAELCDGNYESADVYPIFYGAYWTGEQMEEWVRENSVNHYYYRLFDQIHNEITDRSRIEKLLGEGVVFGFCASDSRVMEITYNDGSVATVMVGADAVQ